MEAGGLELAAMARLGLVVMRRPDSLAHKHPPCRERAEVGDAMEVRVEAGLQRRRCLFPSTAACSWC